MLQIPQAKPKTRLI